MPLPLVGGRPVRTGDCENRPTKKRVNEEHVNRYHTIQSDQRPFLYQIYRPNGRDRGADRGDPRGGAAGCHTVGRNFVESRVTFSRSPVRIQPGECHDVTQSYVRQYQSRRVPTLVRPVPVVRLAFPVRQVVCPVRLDVAHAQQLQQRQPDGEPQHDRDQRHPEVGDELLLGRVPIARNNKPPTTVPKCKTS